MDDDLLVGRYQRRRLLGSGGMGDVWLADDLELGRQVAIKRLRFGGPAGLEAELIERMLREARVVARLNHPAIVTLHDLLRVEGRPYLVMEYVEGESLADRIDREGMLPWAEVAQVVSDIAGALAAAHRAGVLHRDVKPANVLLDTEGRGHLADFGIARGTDDAVITVAGELVGTVAYMPPEIAKSVDATAASDVWSLGATFYAAVEGAAPFADSGSSPAAIIARLIRDDAPTPRRAGPATGLLGRMLATDPAARPYAAGVAAEVAALLALPEIPLAPETRETSLPREPTRSVGPPAEPDTRPRPPRRRRWPVVAAVLVLVAALAGVGYVVLQDDGGGGGGGGGNNGGDPPQATGFEPQDAGDQPTRPELAPDGTAYVASRGDNLVTEVDPTGETRTIPVGDAPGVVTVSSDGSRAFVPCDGEVSAIDTESGKVVGQVRVDGVAGPLRLSDDDGTLYVPVDDGTIRVVDAASLDTLATLPVGPAPELVHLTPDGTTAFSPDRQDGTVTVIDTTVPEVVATLDVPGANGIQVTADGTRALVTAGGGTVHVIDVAEAEVVDVIDLGGETQGRVRIHPDDQHAWVPDTEGTTVDVIDLESGEVERSVEVGGTPGGLVVFDSTGETAYVPDYDSGDVAVIEVPDYDVAHIAVGEMPRQLALRDDGAVLYAVGYRGGDPSQGTVTAVALP